METQVKHNEALLSAFPSFSFFLFFHPVIGGEEEASGEFWLGGRF